jgi:hypothetical protein
MTVLLLAGLASIVTPGLLVPNPGEASRRLRMSSLWYCTGAPGAGGCIGVPPMLGSTCGCGAGDGMGAGGGAAVIGPMEIPLACSAGVKDGPAPEKYWPQKSVLDALG